MAGRDPGAQVRTQRPLGLADLSHCMALSQEAGWNQTEADWRLILSIGRGMGVLDAGRLVASAAIVPHGPTLGWICMVLVAREARRQGLATRLMKWAIDDLEAEGRVAGLDATPAGREVYQRLGFSGRATLTRLQAERFGRHEGETAPVRPLGETDLPAVARFDAAIFGADRGPVLRALHMRRPDLAAVAHDGGRIAGYVVGRDGRSATHIGPVVAETESTARALLAHALAHVAGPVLIDVSDRHGEIAKWLGAQGFAPQRSFTRMLNGAHPVLLDPPQIVAAAGPELA